MRPNKGRRRGFSAREIAVFAMLGTVMYMGDILMEWAPNIHFVGVLTVAFTMVYRAKALVPLYIYVFLNGLYAGFSMWWMPYLYIWIILWGMTMLIPRGLHVVFTTVLCSAVCALHGFVFGILYAPAQAIMFGLDFKSTAAWIISGLPFDLLHGIGDLAASVIIIPLVTLLCRLEHIPKPFRLSENENKQ